METSVEHSQYTVQKAGPDRGREPVSDVYDLR